MTAYWHLKGSKILETTRRMTMKYLPYAKLNEEARNQKNIDITWLVCKLQIKFLKSRFIEMQLLVLLTHEILLNYQYCHQKINLKISDQFVSKFFYISSWNLFDSHILSSICNKLSLIIGALVILEMKLKIPILAVPWQFWYSLILFQT